MVRGAGPAELTAAQRALADRNDPTERYESAEATEPADRNDPIERTEPALPIDRIDPLDAIDRTEPVDHSDRIEPVEPTDHSELDLTTPNLPSGPVPMSLDGPRRR